MKGIRNIFAAGSLVVFVVSFVAFVICVFAGYYGFLLHSGLTALIAFAVLFSVGDTLNNDAYVSHFRRS